MRIIFLIIAYIFVFCPKCFAESISDSEIVASSYLIKRNDMAVFSLSGKSLLIGLYIFLKRFGLQSQINTKWSGINILKNQSQFSLKYRPRPPISIGNEQ